MATDGPEISAERREMLAEKGRRLYGKYCGTGGRGICSESFAVYHIGRGEAVVAADLLAYLECRAVELVAADPEGRRAMTAGMIERVRRHLAAAAATFPGADPPGGES